ncbi:MAG TPA: alcohol dehydrogenase catalytic domain-containing protein [Acidimicrobiales bacterium]|nr:alcohol dehydrogenase catalytic domain-containing protein [Acidimicrobiales bacterium]
MVRIAGAGACHSDLHLMHDFDPGLLPYTLPLTLGHENTHVSVVGGGSFGFDFFSLPYEVSLATTYWGTLPELSEVPDLARQGLVKAHIQRFGLDDATNAYDALSAGQLEGRAVIVPWPVIAAGFATRSRSSRLEG